MLQNNCLTVKNVCWNSQTSHTMSKAARKRCDPLAPSHPLPGSNEKIRHRGVPSVSIFASVVWCKIMTHLSHNRRNSYIKPSHTHTELEWLILDCGSPCPGFHPSTPAELQWSVPVRHVMIVAGRGEKRGSSSSVSNFYRCGTFAFRISV